MVNGKNNDEGINMIEIKGNKLVVSFPEVHAAAKGSIEFQRTLRIPDDNRSYDLPPGLGNFPLQHVDDFSDKLPERWSHHGGVFFPMYQAEAMWINFSGGYPMAIKIAAGKINAVTGKEWNNTLHDDPQDYVVTPEQPWLDGYNVSDDMIRQFVAMPLGEGYTAEEQLTGEAIFGGLQIIAYPMKAEVYEKIMSKPKGMDVLCKSMVMEPSFIPNMDKVMDMGLAPGGLMKQEIYDDEYGIDVWDTDNASRCYVHIMNSEQYHHVTGSQAPYKSPTAKEYTNAGLPWFDYYDEGKKSLPGSGKLAGLDSVAVKGIKKGEKPLPENSPVSPTNTVHLGTKKKPVREGIF